MDKKTLVLTVKTDVTGLDDETISRLRETFMDALVFPGVTIESQVTHLHQVPCSHAERMMQHVRREFDGRDVRIPAYMRRMGEQ